MVIRFIYASNAHNSYSSAIKKLGKFFSGDKNGMHFEIAKIVNEIVNKNKQAGSM